MQEEFETSVRLKNSNYLDQIFDDQLKGEANFVVNYFLSETTISLVFVACRLAHPDLIKKKHTKMSTCFRNIAKKFKCFDFGHR